MSADTLTSLAMLKVNVDQGRDYLDYLRPFILHVLIAHRPDPITDAVVRDYLRTDFGLEIPDRAVQVVLRRLSRQNPLKKEAGAYRITGELPDPRIGAARADASRHITAVIAGLREFSQSTPRRIASDEEAVTAICAFLTQFNIPCFRAYLRGTAIPTVEGLHDAQIALVSNYVLTLQGNPGVDLVGEGLLHRAFHLGRRSWRHAEALRWSEQYVVSAPSALAELVVVVRARHSLCGEHPCLKL